MAVLSAFGEIKDPHMIYSQIARQLDLKYLYKKEKDEIELLLGLVRGGQQTIMLQKLQYIFGLKSPFYHPSKYVEFKQIVVRALINQQKRSNALTLWLIAGKKKAPKKIKDMLAALQD